MKFRTNIPIILKAQRLAHGNKSYMHHEVLNHLRKLKTQCSQWQLLDKTSTGKVGFIHGERGGDVSQQKCVLLHSKLPQKHLINL